MNRHKFLDFNDNDFDNWHLLVESYPISESEPELEYDYNSDPIYPYLKGVDRAEYVYYKTQELKNGQKGNNGN